MAPETRSVMQSTAQELVRLNRTLTALSRSSQATMRAGSEKDYLNEVCRIVVEQCGHAMVWIGYAEEDESRTVRPVTWAGFEDRYLETLQVRWDDTEHGRGPTGTAIRNGRPVSCRDMQTDPKFLPWRDEALRRGYASSLALPLLSEGRAFGAVTIYSRQPDAFPDEEIHLLAELAADVALGIASFRLREARVQAEEALRAAKNELEERVAERTAELVQANQRLKEENEERLRTEQSLRLEEARLDALLRLNQIEEASFTEIAAFVLEEGIVLTRSSIGFVGLLNEDESVYTLHAISKNVVRECNVVGDPMQWRIADAGLWADAVRERRTLFINDYSQPHEKKKGLPPGHLLLTRFMIVPFFEGKKIVLVAGVGNKTSAYDRSDERQLVLLLGGMWNCIQKSRAREALQKSYDELERKVEHRTAELAETNVALQEEITERRRAEEALRKINDELEQRVAKRTAELTRTVGTLRERSEQLRVMTSELTLAEQRERQRLAQVLHDGLQQLLVGARFRLALLERSGDAEARRAAADLGELISDSIEISRSLTAELSPPILREAGLAPALEWLARWMQQKQGLTVDLGVESAIGPIGEDITVLLFHATRELLFNVVKHAGVKSARVRLVRSGTSIIITVADEGDGFDPNHLRAKGGTAGGLGLFSIAERLDLLGGSMEIDSAPGRGSRFTLIAHAGPSERHEPADGRRAPPSLIVPHLGPPADAGKIRIVLVDDHMVVRQGLAALLREENDIAIVGEASDGESALGLIRRVRPDVVLMDVSMPGMNGIETTRIIRAELPEVQVIGLSMFNEVEQAEAMRNAGAADYLAKTGPSEALATAIRTLSPRRQDGSIIP